MLEVVAGNTVPKVSRRPQKRLVCIGMLVNFVGAAPCGCPKQGRSLISGKMKKAVRLGRPHGVAPTEFALVLTVSENSLSQQS